MKIHKTLILAGIFIVKTSGAKIGAQLWRINEKLMVWDGINWYSADAFELPKTN